MSLSVAFSRRALRMPSTHQARIPLAAGIASSHLYCYAAQLQSVQLLLNVKSARLNCLPVIIIRAHFPPISDRHIGRYQKWKLGDCLSAQDTLTVPGILQTPALFLPWRLSYLLFQAITWRPSPAPVRGHSTTILFCLVLGPFPDLAQVLSPLRLLQSWPTHFQD